MSANNNYKHAPVWRKSMDLAIAVNHVVRAFPENEKEFQGLSCQLLQAAIRIPSRIAESRQSFSYQPEEMLQMARFHLSETEFLLEVSLHLGYIPEIDWIRLADSMRDIRELINSSLRKQEQRAVLH